MNTEQKIEGNKLIAEFMGMTFHESTKEFTYIHETDGQAVLWSGEDIPYDTSWDWLMPVVEKIEQDEKIATLIYVNAWDNRGKYCFSIFRELDENGNIRNKFVEYACSNKIEAVWMGVVEFIRIKNEGMIPRTEEDFNKNYEKLQRKMTTLQYPNE